ncbi:hypothetical protein GWI33_017249 [Rhynchophorus ferrugineus]|uniref:Uncharacterized protein n=1 Tax=Rhynchophorus ferrugineus TaxID=354439 RepID=A0A834M6D6_RHYFE|nr:hypothetical protein GWI33_017249 [Rhynchophorus ferrugineus]
MENIILAFPSTTACTTQLIGPFLPFPSLRRRQTEPSASRISRIRATGLYVVLVALCSRRLLSVPTPSVTSQPPYDKSSPHVKVTSILSTEATPRKITKNTTEQ